MLLGNFKINNILKTVNEAIKKLSTRVDGKSISMIPVQHLLQKINNKEFKTREDALVFYASNIYDKYEMKVKSMKTKNAKEMGDMFNDVRKIFIKPSKPSAPVDQTDDKTDTEQKEQGQGLKILTRKQMIIRLQILLAQLKAANNSEKLKNEIRQLEYSLYRSKNLSKNIYNNLIGSI